jgi:hypothetical protein
VAGGLFGPRAPTLPNNFMLLIPEIDGLKNSVDKGRHGNFVLDVILSREVIKNVTAYVEMWSDTTMIPSSKQPRHRGLVDRHPQCAARWDLHGRCRAGEAEIGALRWQTIAYPAARTASPRLGVLPTT